MDRHYQSRARAVLLACVLLALIAQLALLPVRAMAAAPSDDLALNKTAVADSRPHIQLTCGFSGNIHLRIGNIAAQFTFGIGNGNQCFQRTVAVNSQGYGVIPF